MSYASPTKLPDGVPADALWDEKRQCFRVGKRNEKGALDGPQRLYRASGSLLAEVTYVDGKAYGAYRKFHPNGELARQGEYDGGVPVGLEVAYTSSAPTDEPLQRCCVPPGAVKLVLNHRVGGDVWEDFYDAQGRVLLPNGEPQPARPATVEAEARYKPHDEVWRTETYTDNQRSGTWRTWSAAGELLEVVAYENNRLHGGRQVWRQGDVQSSWQYVQGVRHGKGWERVPAGTYENPAIVRQCGEFTHGVPTGAWTYLAANEAVVLTLDLGPELNEVSERDAAFARPVSEAASPVFSHPLLAFVHSLRQAAARGTAPLEALLAARPVWLPTGSERWLRALRGEQLSKGKYLARLLEGLRRGASAPDVLCVMARLALDTPDVALALSDMGSLLKPEHVDLHAVRVMAFAELGQVEQAHAANRALLTLDATAHAELEAWLHITFPTFDFWPDKVTLETHASDELPDVVAQDVTAVRRTMGKVALRLRAVRNALLERLRTTAHAVTWLPPDPSPWLVADVTLERYEFDVPGDDEQPSDHVVVDETPELDECSLSTLMNRARVEWAALCWLAFAVGADAVRLPAVIDPQPAFGRALTTAFARLYRVADQLKTRGYRARAQGVPDASWEGIAIDALPERLLARAHAEFSEMRAVLFFLSDATCRSLWQDDLRG